MALDVLNITLNSLSLLKNKPLFLDHVLRFLMSVLRIDFVDWIFVMEVDRYKLVLPAYSIELDFRHNSNDETYVLNKTGPRILPCGTQNILMHKRIFYHLIASTIVHSLGS